MAFVARFHFGGGSAISRYFLTCKLFAGNTKYRTDTNVFGKHHKL